MDKKKSSLKIQEVDSLLVDHSRLIQSMVLCGMDKSYHDPRIGYNFILTKDNWFNVSCHEGAHSFLSQRGPFGLLTSILSALLHVQFLEMELGYKKMDKVEYMRKVTVYKRIREVRKVLINNLRLSHEIYAIGTEIVGMLQKSLPQGVFLARMEERFAKGIKSSEIINNEKGYKVHDKALAAIVRMTNIYGDLEYARKAAELIVGYFPTLITNINPSDILFGKEEISSIMPEIDRIYQSLIECPPDFAATQKGYLYNALPLFNMICEKLSKFSIYNEIFKNMKVFLKWYNELMSLLPLSEKYRELYEEIMANTMRFVLVGGTRRQNQLKKYTHFETIDRSTFQGSPFYEEVHNFTITLENSVGIKSGEEEEIIFQDPLLIPPPLTIFFEEGNFKLYIRDDLNSPNGLFHLCYRTSKMRIIDNTVDKCSDPVLCFNYHCSIGRNFCKDGLENCPTVIMMKYLLAAFELNNKMRLTPLLICCKGDLAQIIEFCADFEYKPSIIGAFPFELVIFKPEIKGVKIVE